MLQTGKDVVDAVAGTSIVASGFATGIVPILTIGLPSIWFIIRIWESDTVKGLTKRDKKEGE